MVTSFSSKTRTSPRRRTCTATFSAVSQQGLVQFVAVALVHCRPRHLLWLPEVLPLGAASSSGIWECHDQGCRSSVPLPQMELLSCKFKHRGFPHSQTATSYYFFVFVFFVFYYTASACLSQHYVSKKQAGRYQNSLEGYGDLRLTTSDVYWAEI